MASTTPSGQILDELDFELYDRKGADWTDVEKQSLSKELRAFAATCLSPVPDYNCLAHDYSTAFDDKLLVIARSTTTGQIVGFTSTVFLTGFGDDDHIPFVLPPV